MTAMEIHDAIGQGMVIVLLSACGVALAVLLVLFASRLLDDDTDALLDVCDSHLKTADGKAWKFPAAGADPRASGAPRARIHVPAYREPGPDEEEEGGPDDTGEVVDFEPPDYDALAQAPGVKTLKPRG